MPQLPYRFVLFLIGAIVTSRAQAQLRSSILFNGSKISDKPVTFSTADQCHFASRRHMLSATNILAALSLMVVCSPTQAIMPCADLITQIETNLAENGVTHYSLAILPNSAAQGQNVVGSCDGGTKKIVYSLLTASQNAVSASASASASECATMLEGVRTGDNVNVAGKCDQATERQMIKEILNASWKTQCQYAIPSLGWKAYKDAEENTNTLLPNPMNYFSQFDFEFISNQGFLLSQTDFVYVHGLSWEETKSQVWLGKPEYDAVVKIRQLYPPNAAISYEAGSLIGSEKISDVLKQFDKNRVSNFKFRRAIVYEDGKQYFNETMGIFRDSPGKVRSRITLLGHVDPYPTWAKASQGTPQIIDLSCVAKNTISPEIFGALCAMMIEKQYLAPILSEGKSCNVNEEDNN